MKKQENKRTLVIHKLNGNKIDIEREEEYVMDYCDPEEIYNLMNRIFRFKRLKREYSYIIALDEEYHPISILRSPPGEKDSVELDFLDMAYYTKAVNAKYIIQAHNHPVGDPTPSLDDIKIFLELHTIFGKQLWDYMICGSDDPPPFCEKYYSFDEKGYFEHLHNIYSHHFDKVTISLLKGLEDLDYGFWEIREEIDKIKNSIKELEITLNNNGKTQGS